MPKFKLRVEYTVTTIHEATFIGENESCAKAIAHHFNDINYADKWEVTSTDHKYDGEVTELSELEELTNPITNEDVEKSLKAKYEIYKKSLEI